jgi:hypothetical protein
MSYAREDYDDPHENCVPKEEALTYVRENEWEHVDQIIRETQRLEWLSESQPCLNLLSIVSQRDRAHALGAIKKWLRRGQAGTEEITDEQLFAIAADVCAFLEQLSASVPGSSSLMVRLDGYQRLQEPNPARCIVLSGRSCGLEDDLSWARDLLTISRAFRDLLSAASEAEPEASHLRQGVRESIGVFNDYLRKTPSQPLVYWQDQTKDLKFGHCPDPESLNLASYIANWICDYLIKHFPDLTLGVCAECGKFFGRERRDKAFCSKTCQNRVAYKRKKILESDALSQIIIAPDDACDISAGLWMHHPRFGIGLVESVSSASKPTLSTPVRVANQIDQLRYRSMLGRRLLVRVRFLHGIRSLGFADLFEGQKKEDQLPTFYEVKSEEILAELL